MQVRNKRIFVLMNIKKDLLGFNSIYSVKEKKKCFYIIDQEDISPIDYQQMDH